MSATGPILVVDDDEGIREIIETALTDEGYDVVTAINGSAALALVRQHPPAIILLDMRMPIMDGWEFAQAYHQQPGPHAPIVVVTAARTASERAEQIGAEGVLAKPFLLTELFAVVDQYMLQ